MPTLNLERETLIYCSEKGIEKRVDMDTFISVRQKAESQINSFTQAALLLDCEPL